jgi:hypothetical protein
MTKKILIIVFSIIAIAGGVAALSAFEAHVINVTAHIENALSVDLKEISFGTVFPQEYGQKSYWIRLSDSFLKQERVDLVNYKIVQKPKPIDPNDSEWCHNWVEQHGTFRPIDPGFDLFSNPEYLARCYPPLCFYLSKEPDSNPANDTGVPAYHKFTDIAYGTLVKTTDPSDEWTIDLDVPCFKGQCAQDWQHPGWELPAELEGKTFGCDLWIEVTGIYANPVCTPTTEVCDGLDNDCDNEIDEENVCVPWINEIHYDNTSIDINEGVEIAGRAEIDLTGWTVVLYNGGSVPPGMSYYTLPLSGTILDQQAGFGTLWFGLPTNGIQNGSPDGLALVSPSSTVIQFLSYEGTFMAMDGPAISMISVDIGVSETNTTPIDQSLQLQGSGNEYADFIWAGPVTHTRGAVNLGQTFIP